MQWFLILQWNHIILMECNGVIFISLIKYIHADAKEYLTVYSDCSYSLQCNGLMIFQCNGFIALDLFCVLLTA